MARRLKTVLFAEVSGREEYVRAAGRVIGWNGISDCINGLQQTARSCGGKVVKVIGAELMMLFESPDAAAVAASKMHAAVNGLPAVAGARLSVKVGYHAGPVIEGSDDLLGDTVKQVAALLRQARAGETITTPQTARLLDPSYSGAVTVPASGTGPRNAQAQRMLRFTYGSESATCGVDNRMLLVGRDPSCGLVTATAFASRRHCTIFLAADGLKVRDHSSLGTFLTNEGGEELQLAHGQEASLGTRGWISLGCARAFASRLLEFSGQ